MFFQVRPLNVSIQHLNVYFAPSWLFYKLTCTKLIPWNVSDAALQIFMFKMAPLLKESSIIDDVLKTDKYPKVICRLPSMLSGLFTQRL